MELKVVIFVFTLTVLVGFKDVQTVSMPERERGTEALKAKLDNTKITVKEMKKANKQLTKENKRLKKMLDTSSKKTAPNSDTEKENADLKALLKETRAVNKRLKKQNRRQKQVWFALEQMCQVLGQPPLDDSGNKTKTTEIPAVKEKKKSFRIQPLSIATNYERWAQGETTNVSIEFTARGKPKSQWVLFSLDGGRYVTRGWTKYKETTRTYVSGVELDYQLLKSKFITVRVFDATDIMNVGLNMIRLLRSENHSIENHSIEYPHITIEDKPESIIAPTYNDLNATFYVRGNLSDNIDVGAFINAVNHSDDTTNVVEVLDHDPNINITGNKISINRTAVTVNVTNELCRHGGILGLSFTSRPKTEKLYESLSFSRTFRVLSNETKTVFPPNTIGMYPMPNTTILYGPYQSIMCMAMSEQGADITLNRETTDGLEELPHDFYLADEFTAIKSFTIDENDKQVEGTYICRASSMDMVATTRTEVIKFVEPVFDEIATGVNQNDSSQVKIRCKASGSPVPYLELRLYNRYGPDLSSSPRYQAVRTNPDPSTSVLDVTVSPVDKDIYRVYCAITQEDGYGSVKVKEIQIFPEPESGPNWTLYYSF